MVIVSYYRDARSDNLFLKEKVLQLEDQIVDQQMENHLMIKELVGQKLQCQEELHKLSQNAKQQTKSQLVLDRSKNVSPPKQHKTLDDKGLEVAPKSRTMEVSIQQKEQLREEAMDLFHTRLNAIQFPSDCSKEDNRFIICTLVSEDWVVFLMLIL